MNVLIVSLLCVIIVLNVYELYRHRSESYVDPTCSVLCQPLVTDDSLGLFLQSKLSQPLLNQNGYLVTQSPSSPPLNLFAYTQMECQVPAITVIGRMMCDMVCTNSTVLNMFNQMLSLDQPVTSIAIQHVNCSLEFFFEMASVSAILNNQPQNGLYVMDMKLNPTDSTSFSITPDPDEEMSRLATMLIANFYENAVPNPPASCTFQLATMKEKSGYDVFKLMNDNIPHSIPVPIQNRWAVYKPVLSPDDNTKFLLELIQKVQTMKILTLGSNEDSRWMSTLSGSQRLTDLSIPGAHDALTYNWKESNSDLKSMVTSHWAQTQELKVYDLLRAGTRYFDVRIAFVNGEWVGQHGEYPNPNVTYESALNQLRTFVKEQPREIVMWKVKLYTPENDILRRLTQQYLSPLVLPTSFLAQPLTEIWKTAQNVMLITDDNQFAPYQETIKIANVGDAVAVLSSIYSQTHSPLLSKLLVLQWIAVYNMNEKDVNLLYSVRSIATELNEESVLKSQLPRPPVGRVQNVVMIDFADASANRAIYKRNLL